MKAGAPSCPENPFDALISPPPASLALLPLTLPPSPHRSVIILVKAGAPVDQTVDQLMQYMEPGDIIIDGGNEW